MIEKGTNFRLKVKHIRRVRVLLRGEPVITGKKNQGKCIFLRSSQKLNVINYTKKKVIMSSIMFLFKY